MKKEGAKGRQGAVFLLISLILIIVFPLYTVRTDLYAEDPLCAAARTLLTGERHQMLFVPTSPRPVSVTVETDSPGTDLALEMTAEGQKMLLFARTDGEGYAVFSLPEESLFTPGEPVEAVIFSQGEVSLMAFEDGGVWYRTRYLWADMTALRLAGMAAGALYALFIWFFALRRGAPAEKVFLAAALPVTVLFVFIMPIYRAPDEAVHFMRSLGIAKGVFILPPDGAVSLAGNIVPSHLEAPYSDYFSLYSLMTGGGYALSAKTASFGIRNAALYDPLVYLFSALGSGIADIFSDDLYVIFLSGRLLNAAGCTMMIWLAIKIIPDGKALLALISLMPINLQERASVSADAMTYAAAVLLTAYVLYMRFGDGKMDGRHLLRMYLLLILTGACKVVYFAMAALILLIPAEKFASKKAAALHRTLGIMLAVAVAVGWIFIAGRYLSATQGGGNSAEKVIYALTHPLWYIKLMGVTAAARLPGWGLQMTAPPFGYFDIPVSVAFGALLSVMLLGWSAVLAAGRHKKGLSRDGQTTLWTVLASFAVTMLIFASLYVQWTEGTPPDIGLIEGIQGRYFLPFLPALLMGITGIPAKEGRSAEPEGAGNVMTGTAGVVSLMVLVNIIMSLGA